MKENKKAIISVASTIEIQKNVATVFNYISDLRLDKNWRQEINETIVADPDQKLNSVAIEDSFLSKRVPNHKATLTCTEFLANQVISYQSTPENAFWLKSSRQVKALSPETTRLIYQLEFDTAVVKHGLRFGLPPFFLKLYTRSTMKKYLKKLKQILETSKAPV